MSHHRAALVSLAACALAGAPLTALAHGKAHVHGVAEMQVSTSGDELRVSFVSPLDNLVGFERAPRDEAERATIRKMAEQLRAPDAIRPAAAARCALVETRLASTAIDPALLGMSGAPVAPRAAAKKDDHADLEMVSTYKCENAAGLQSIEIDLLKRFPKLRRIDVQVAGPTRQSMMRLTADRRTVSLK